MKKVAIEFNEKIGSIYFIVDFNNISTVPRTISDRVLKSKTLGVYGVDTWICSQCCSSGIAVFWRTPNYFLLDGYFRNFSSVATGREVALVMTSTIGGASSIIFDELW